VTIQLGVLTDTGDAEGQVLATKAVPELSNTCIHICLDAFIGETEQIPPMYSALKYQGRKLYELARKGIIVERKPRKITLFELKLIAFHKTTLTLEVFCSKGTYIRSLAEDIGQTLHTVGTVTALRRLQSGQFNLQDSYTLEQLTTMDHDRLKKCLLSVDTPLTSLQKIDLSDEQAISLFQGQKIVTQYSSQGKIRMYNQQRFLGLGEIHENGMLAPKKLFNLP
jgi:tRNA pseudouridine55 synthase